MGHAGGVAKDSFAAKANPAYWLLYLAAIWRNGQGIQWVNESWRFYIGTCHVSAILWGFSRTNRGLAFPSQFLSQYRSCGSLNYAHIALR